MTTRRDLLTSSLALGAALASPNLALAQRSIEESIERANDGRIGLMTGGADGTYVKVGWDLATVLNGKEGLRIIPMLGSGSAQNILDLLYLKYTDMALVQSDVMEQIRRSPERGLERDRLAYITKIYNEEVHVLARRDTNIKQIGDLEGKKVNVGGIGSGSRITSDLLLSFFQVSVQKYTYSTSDAFAALLRGELEAMIFVQKKPADWLVNLPLRNNLQLVPIDFMPALRGTYTRAFLGQDDYPTLIRDLGVSSIAVSTILAVYNNFSERTLRYQNLATFCRLLFDHLPVLKQAQRAPRWGSTDLNTDVLGWPRFKPMQDVLDNRSPLEPRRLWGNGQSVRPSGP